MSKVVAHNIVTLFVIHNVISNVLKTLNCDLLSFIIAWKKVINSLKTTQNYIMNGIMNDKKPFPLYEQSWYRTALLKLRALDSATNDTRMYSSRMRTAHFSCHLGVGGGLPGGSVYWCVSARGCLPREVSTREVSVQGGCLPRGVCPLSPVNRMTDRCKNITLPQTSLAGGNKGGNGIFLSRNN